MLYIKRFWIAWFSYVVILMVLSTIDVMARTGGMNTRWNSRYLLALEARQNHTPPCIFGRIRDGKGQDRDVYVGEICITSWEGTSTNSYWVPPTVYIKQPYKPKHKFRTFIYLNGKWHNKMRFKRYQSGDWMLAKVTGYGTTVYYNFKFVYRKNSINRDSYSDMKLCTNPKSFNRLQGCTQNTNTLSQPSQQQKNSPSAISSQPSQHQNNSPSAYYFCAYGTPSARATNAGYRWDQCSAIYKGTEQQALARCGGKRIVVNPSRSIVQRRMSKECFGKTSQPISIN